MPEFHYKAVTPEGRLIKGSQVAYTPKEIESNLKKEGLYLLDISRKRANLALMPSSRIGLSNLITFSFQLHSIVTSGISLLRGMDDIASQEKNIKFKKIIEDIRQRVEAGEPLSKAFAAHGKVFPPFYIGAIRSGEESGMLGIVLEDLIEYLEKQEEFRAQLRQALIYPVVIIFVLSGVALFYLTVLLPQVIGLVQELQATLPWPTQVTLALSNVLRKFWYLIPLYVIGIPLAIYSVNRTKKGKHFLDSMKLKLPIISEIIKKSTLAKFTRSLSLLMKSGLDVIAAMEVMKEVITNSVINQCIIKVKNSISQGKFLSEAMSHLPFTPIMLGMFAVSEEAGQINTAMDRATLAYEKEVSRTLKKVLTLLEPIIIVTFGLFFAGILVSVLLPMYDSITQMGTM
jgi:type IV pilus assembly protein PilC